MNEKLNFKKCCRNSPIFIIMYHKKEVFLVCSRHSKKIEYQTGIERIFDYETKRELNRFDYFQKKPIGEINQI